MGSDWHGVNCRPPFVVEDQHDDLKKVPGLVWTDDEETVGRSCRNVRENDTEQHLRGGAGRFASPEVGFESHLGVFRAHIATNRANLPIALPEVRASTAEVRAVQTRRSAVPVRSGDLRGATYRRVEDGRSS